MPHRPLAMIAIAASAAGAIILLLAYSGLFVLESESTTTASDGQDTLYINPLHTAKTLHSLVNEEREKRGLDPLQWDEELAEIAARHSWNMVHLDYFAHIDPNGVRPADRYYDAGYFCMGGAVENISAVRLGGGLDEKGASQRILEKMLQDEENAANMFSEELTSEGIGITVLYELQSVYVTQNFC